MNTQLTRLVILIGLGILVKTPAAALCRPPFPLPSSPEVGQRWTYSGLGYSQWQDSEGIERSESHFTYSVSVVARIQIAGRTYFELEEGGFYRVDEDGRTWKYDAGTGTEGIHWDIMGPPVAGSCYYEDASVRCVYYGDADGEDYGSIWIAGKEWKFGDGFDISRYGPFERHEWDSLPWLGESWIDEPQSSLLRQSLLDERITEIYRFVFAAWESVEVMIFAPDFGVLYCGASYGWPSDGGGTSYVLDSSGGSGTGVQHLSLGRLKAGAFNRDRPLPGSPHTRRNP